MQYEIERRWMVTGFPELSCPLLKDERMEQGYVSVRPTVRIRKEEDFLNREAGTRQILHMLCFKTDGLLKRGELEWEIDETKYETLREMIGLPMIQKRRKSFLLPDGVCLEVNHVDEGLPTEFWYAEIEFQSEAAAKEWRPEGMLSGYLANEVTGMPGQSMGAYWEQTRLIGSEKPS